MSIMPMAEDILMYTADQRNIQFVDEVYSIVILSCMPLLTWPSSTSGKYETLGSTAASASGLLAIMVAKSMEFSYQELAKATNNFSSDNKIGQEDGCSSINRVSFRVEGLKTCSSLEFGAFDWILRRRISLLVYEYIENENLGQYLHGTGREPLAWSTRVQIALDSARGIEYIHEHTVPVYIHRDVKPANILIYKDFREKVANFGLTKLWEVGSSLSLHTRLVRTFGYMPPVYFWQSNQKKTSYKKSWLD
ncbi:hypothetical protein AHAS_Ahas16G0211700 [Arachis hypogaea]